jgi:hypothetical protein
MKASISKAALMFAGALGASLATSAQGEYRPTPSEGVAFVRNICIDVMRIRPGFVPFDACVESLSETLKQKSTGLMVREGISASYPEPTSYSQSNAEERRRKEEYSCAQLGIAPGTAGFGRCVAELDSALRSTEHSE